MTEELLPLCECDCGLRVTKKGNRFIRGHQNRGVPHTSPAQIAADKAKSERQLGVPRTSEACAAISAGKLGVPHTSPAQIAADEAESKRRCGVSLSPEHCAAISAGKLGVPRTSEAQIAADDVKRGAPLSPKHCDAISAAKLGVLHTSPVQIASDEFMYGGNDICNHHYLYDHNDLSLNTVQMSRSDHGKLHRLLQILGYIIPHINR